MVAISGRSDPANRYHLEGTEKIPMYRLPISVLSTSNSDAMIAVNVGSGDVAPIQLNPPQAEGGGQVRIKVKGNSVP
jgi:hypothetical protein